MQVLHPAFEAFQEGQKLQEGAQNGLPIWALKQQDLAANA